MSQRFTKLVVQVEVVGPHPYEWNTLGDIWYDITDGDYSGHVEVISHREVDLEELDELSIKHCTALEFFLGEEE
jgi:hypothetical protein